MEFDFDAAIDRRGTGCSKWDGMAPRTGVTARDGIAMWVADMDFAAPPPVRVRLAALIEHGVFGYHAAEPDWKAAAAGWSARRHGWEVDPDWITPSAGVCAAIGIAAQAFSEPGEGVVLFPPVYHMFAHMIRAAGRRPVESPLVLRQGRYEMDLERLAAELPDDARILLLCSPHNPGGRVWTPQELRALADFCAERRLVLLSDEIWRDLVFDGARFTPTALAAPDAAPLLVTFVAPSKTFNLAGGQLAEAVIADPALRARYRAVAAASHGMSGALFGTMAAIAAYRDGGPWLDALRRYLQGNRDRFASGVAAAVPGARAMALEATYLAWVDFSGTGLPAAEVARRLREDARIGVNAGPTFGTGGETWARFNFGCPRATVDAALGRLAEAFRDLR
jgi:cystathionine beta-lyase